MNRFLIALTAIVVASQGARAEEIRFEKVAEYTTGLSPDQRRIDSYKMIGDSIFYTTYFFFAHQGFSGSSIRCLNRSSGDDRLLVTLYRTLPSGEITVHEISPGITGEIVRIGNVVHFPDVENYSYQCTLDGKYLGRFPDYDPDSDDENDIIVEGIKIKFPYIIESAYYFDAIVSDEYVFFVGEDRYLFYYRSELAEKGAYVSRKKRLPLPVDRVEDAALIQSRANKIYLVYRTDQEYKVAVVRNVDSIEESFLESVDVEQPPKVLYGYSPPYLPQFVGEYFYRVEHDYTVMLPCRIVQYRLAGLEGTSSVDEPIWLDFK